MDIYYFSHRSWLWLFLIKFSLSLFPSLHLSSLLSFSLLFSSSIVSGQLCSSPLFYFLLFYACLFYFPLPFLLFSPLPCFSHLISSFLLFSTLLFSSLSLIHAHCQSMSSFLSISHSIFFLLPLFLPQSFLSPRQSSHRLGNRTNKERTSRVLSRDEVNTFSPQVLHV